MGKIIIPNAIKRKKGFLYYVNNEGDIYESKLYRWRRKRKKCINCGNKLINTKSKYCSEKCFKEFKLKEEIRKKYRKELVKGKCLICKKEFPKRNKSHKICSDECRKKYHKNVKNFTFFKNISLQELPKGLVWFKLRFEIFKRDNFTCQYCGRNVKDDKIKLHIDHIIPKDCGGKDVIENLRTSCEECNLGKRDIILELKTFHKKEDKYEKNPTI